MKMRIAISPEHYLDDFPNGLKQKDKIEVYYARAKGWQLIPAQETVDKIEHSGFAVLHIVMSFFESIAKYREGYRNDDRSNEFFRKGFELVFPEVHNVIPEPTIRKCYLDFLYEKVRCGLYHSSMTGAGILINNDIKPVFDMGPEGITLNPKKLVEAMMVYLDKYRDELKDPKNTELRKKFERKFDFDGTP